MAGTFRRVDAIGRIVIPVDMRRELGLEPGAKFTVEREGGAVVIRPVGEKCPVCGGLLEEDAA